MLRPCRGEKGERFESREKGEGRFEGQERVKPRGRERDSRVERWNGDRVQGRKRDRGRRGSRERADGEVRDSSNRSRRPCRGWCRAGPGVKRALKAAPVTDGSNGRDVCFAITKLPVSLESCQEGSSFGLSKISAPEESRLGSSFQTGIHNRGAEQSSSVCRAVRKDCTS
eukprot:1984012-Rhodomonas_salina.3